MQKRAEELQKGGEWEIFETKQFALLKIVKMFNLLKCIYECVSFFFQILRRYFYTESVKKTLIYI